MLPSNDGGVCFAPFVPQIVRAGPCVSSSIRWATPRLHSLHCPLYHCAPQMGAPKRGLDCRSRSYQSLSSISAGNSAAAPWLARSHHDSLILYPHLHGRRHARCTSVLQGCSVLRPVTVRKCSSLPQALTPFARALGDLV